MKNDLIQHNFVPFVPHALIGRRFVPRPRDKQTRHNWFGYKRFDVVGDVGPYDLPGHETYAGKDCVLDAQVMLETETGMVLVSRHEFIQLVTEIYK
jgi:hypothetical protein